jgi:hypothetical protein
MAYGQYSRSAQTTVLAIAYEASFLDFVLRVGNVKRPCELTNGPYVADGDWPCRESVETG